MLPPGGEHLSPAACIAGLRTTLLRQRELAATLGFEISVRFLMVLEDLVQDPDIGIAYKTRQDGEPRVLPAILVSGLFSAILAKYQEQCDWTPLHDARRDLASARGMLVEVQEFVKHNDLCQLHDLYKRIVDYLTPPGVPPPDPAGS